MWGFSQNQLTMEHLGKLGRHFKKKNNATAGHSDIKGIYYSDQIGDSVSEMSVW